MDILVKHLGINTPPDLTQGESFNKGIHQFSLESKYSLLQDGSPSSLMSSIETMKGNDTTTLSKYDTEFKQLLSEYTGLLNTVNREILQEQQKYGPMSDYLGKRLKTNSHDTYINEYGYARNIPLSDVVDSSCPQSSDSFNNTCQGLSDAYGVTYSEKAAPIARKRDKSTPCAADYGKKIGDMLPNGNGTITDISQTCSDPEYPICDGFKQGIKMGKCIKNIQLGAKGSNVCSSGMLTISEADCEASAKLVLPAGKTMGRSLQLGSWPQVPPGCSVQSSGDWTAHYNKGDGKNDGDYSLVCEDGPDKMSQTQKNRGNAPTDTTNFGCAPDYAKEWWKHHSCKTKPSSSKHPGCDIASMNTAIFKKGPDMKPGEPCHLAGKNIRNSKTNQVAWVDLTGVKHAYPNSKMRDNLIGCNNKVTVTLDDAKFSNVPTGSPMTNDGICLNISINEQDYTKLLKMNKQLQVLAAKIVNELDTLISKDSETETEIRTKKSSIHAFLKNLKKERKNFDQNKHLIKTMQYQSEDSHVSYVSNKYHMIAWGLLVVGVGGFTIHQLSTRTSL
jgi:hypothetical protein